MKPLLTILVVLGFLGMPAPAMGSAAPAMGSAAPAMGSAAPAMGSAECTQIQPVFGLTEWGDLVEHDYCVGSPAGFQSPRTIATSVQGQVFWGGTLRGNAAVIYGITPAGELWWSRQDTAMGALGARVTIGSSLGSWHSYRSFTSVGGGQLFALDQQGHLVRWIHLGWRDGSDTWTDGREDLGLGCKVSPVVFAAASGANKFVAVQDNPPGYVFCTADAQIRMVSDLPESVEPGTATMAAAPGVVYALTKDSRWLARLALPGRPMPSMPSWYLDAVAPFSYRSIISGGAFTPGSNRPPYKYEWQWDFYDGTYSQPSRTATTAAVIRLSTPSSSSRVAT